ncbi:MAG: hypothetical protein FJ096_01315 [Deltaproteobacteria bacterium]|nr:hypothetical protein [Deltaproteobacteria bacterium]
MSRRPLVLALVSTLVASAAPVSAEPLPPRETADLLPPKSFQVGVFNPLRLGLPHVELELHPLVALVAPHVDARFWLLRPERPGAVRVSGVVGFGVPTPAFHLAKPFGVAGDLVPSCKVAAAEESRARWCDAPGVTLVPKLALWMSKGTFASDGVERGTLTVRAEVTKGFTVSGDAARPLDAWAPATVRFAPALGGWRTEFRAAYDHAVLDVLRVRGELGAYWIGRPEDDPLSPLFLSAYVGVDVRTSEHTRVTAGAVAWNADKHERVVATGADGFAEVRYPRSNEVWPTVDFVWRY